MPKLERSGTAPSEFGKWSFRWVDCRGKSRSEWPTLRAPLSSLQSASWFYPVVQMRKYWIQLLTTVDSNTRLHRVMLVIKNIEKIDVQDKLWLDSLNIKWRIRASPILLCKLFAYILTIRILHKSYMTPIYALRVLFQTSAENPDFSMWIVDQWITK